MSLSPGYERWLTAVDVAHEVMASGRCLWYVVRPDTLTPCRVFWLESAVGSGVISAISCTGISDELNKFIIWPLDILIDNLHDILAWVDNHMPGLIIMDDMECLDRAELGPLLEEVVMRIPENISLLALMARASNIQDIVSWLENIRQRPCHLIKAEKGREQAVPAFFTLETSFIPLCTRKKMATRVKRYLKEHSPVSSIIRGNIVPALISSLRREKFLPAIIFLSSEEECDQAAAGFSCGRSDIGSGLTSSLATELFTRYPAMKEHKGVADALARRTASLHRGHSPEWREIIEFFFLSNYIDIIFSTIDTAPMLITGVNSIVLATSRVRGPGDSVSRQITSSGLLHVLKLCGRYGDDNPGCIILVNVEDVDVMHVKKLLTSNPGQLHSRFCYNSRNVLGFCDAGMTNSADILRRSLRRYQRQETAPRLAELQAELEEQIPEAECTSPGAALRLMELHSRLQIQAGQLESEIRNGKNSVHRKKARRSLDNIRALITQFPCEQCIHHHECLMMKYKKIRTIFNEYYDILFLYRDNPPVFENDFEEYLRLSADSGFIDSELRPTDMGIMALHTGLEFPHLLVESVAKGIIPLDGSTLSRALLAGFVEQPARKQPLPVDDFSDHSLDGAIAAARKAATPARRRLLMSGFLVESPWSAQAQAIFALEKGIILDNIAKKAGVSAGTLAELVKKTDYLEHQLRETEINNLPRSCPDLGQIRSLRLPSQPD